MKNSIFIIAVLSMFASCKPTTNSVETLPVVDSTVVVVDTTVALDTLAVDSLN